jgi:hypothetical protein
MIIDITSHGASTGAADNTAAIQAALNAAQSGDTVYVPPGSFIVNATVGLQPHSHTSLKLDGTLRALPAAGANAIVMLTNAVTDVTITGPGRLVGERSGHPLSGNKIGFCLGIVNASNVTLGGGLVLADAWADGIYMQDATDVTVNGVLCTGNSRNGMSIISGQRITVTNSTFELTRSASPMPQAGIDLEPDTVSQSLIDITIKGNSFTKNAGAGVYIAFAAAANRGRINVLQNTFNQHYRDGSGPPIGGRNTALANFLYATCRWMPGYDYWAFPTTFSA